MIPDPITGVCITPVLPPICVAPMVDIGGVCVMPTTAPTCVPPMVMIGPNGVCSMPVICPPPQIISAGVCVMPVTCVPPQVYDVPTNTCIGSGAPVPGYCAPPAVINPITGVCGPATTSGVPAPTLTSGSTSCAIGMYWDPAMMMCKPNPPLATGPVPSPFMPGMTVPTCPAGQYWDYVQLKCTVPIMPSGGLPSMPSIASCAPGQYFDPMRQACVSGQPMALLPGCTPDGYCPPPPQFSCAPTDPYCRPPPPPDCAQKMQAVRGDMEALFKALSDRMQAFNQLFETERRTFGQSQHSPEEWRAWGEDWRKKGDAIGQEFAQQMTAFVESKGLGACAAFMPPPPMMGGMGPGPDAAPRNYQEMNAPPVNNQFYQEDEAVRQIRMECEAKARALMGASGAPTPGMPVGAPAPGMPPGGMPSPELMQQVNAIMRECEARIRAQFESVYDEQNVGEDLNERFGSFSMYFDEATGEIHVVGKYLSLVGNPESQVLSEVTCGGQKFIDQLYGNGYLENFDFEQTAEGTALTVMAAGARILQIHDNPRCAINLATGGTVTELTLDLADYLDVTQGDGGASFTDGDTDGKILLHAGDLDLEDGNVVVLHSKATFFVTNSAAAQASGSDLSNDLNFRQALEDGNIGAEIIIGGDGNQSTPYGDLDLDVDAGGEGLIVTVDNADHEGKTIVMSVEEEILSIDQLEDVQVDVIDQLEAGDEIMCAEEASNLQDVLDPLDDGDCAEYWVVLDKNGAQVLVSIPHFSTKRIEIQSASSGDEAGGFMGMPGLGILGATLAAAGALVLVVVGLRRKA